MAASSTSAAACRTSSVIAGRASIRRWMSSSDPSASRSSTSAASDADVLVDAQVERVVLHLLGPDADDDVTLDEVGERRSDLEQRRAEVESLRSEVHGQRAAVGADKASLEEVHRRRADERGDEHVVGLVVERPRVAPTCWSMPVAEHGHPVAHRHRLDLVVGDVDRGGLEVALQPGDLRAHLHAELGVEVRQRLVHQEHRRLTHDRPTHRHPLALAAGQLAGLAVEPWLELRACRAASATRSAISAFGRPASLSAKPMFSATVMCGYSA